MSKIYKADTGTILLFDTGSDISAATTAYIRYEKPDASTGYLEGAAYDTTKVKFTTLVGTFDQVGVWKLQAYVVTPSWTGHGEIVEVRVHDDLQ